MIVISRAGYDPDFALVLNRVLARTSPIDGRFETLFNDHPRWSTRVLRELKEYDQAEAIFTERWPDAATSPGGTAPPVVIIKSVSSSQDKQTRALLIPAHTAAKAQGSRVRGARGLRPSRCSRFIVTGGRPVSQEVVDGQSTNRCFWTAGSLQERAPRITQLQGFAD